MRRHWFGIILILVGVLFLMNSMGLFKLNHLIVEFWPVVLILIGIWILLRGRKKTP